MMEKANYKKIDFIVCVMKSGSEKRLTMSVNQVNTLIDKQQSLLISPKVLSTGSIAVYLENNITLIFGDNRNMMVMHQELF